MAKRKSTLKSERLGEKRKANNGQMMTIINYNGVNDIDIEFEDGTIVKHQYYKQFKIGEVRNPNVPVAKYANANRNIKNDRVGETIESTSGLKMTIIRYENAHNIDVRFEDGVVILHKNYANFITGKIKHPTIYPNGIRIDEFAYRKKDDWYYICSHDDWKEQKILPIKEICPEPIITSQKQSERRVIYGKLTNQTNTATNGMKITCIADNGSKDITVMFEDGAIREHQRRESFLNGHIRHPKDIVPNKKRNIKNHIGEEYVDKCGRKLKIVEYFSNSNVTIEYEDGTRLENKEYRIIKKGADLYPKTHVGEKIMARNGLMMEIINDDIWNDLHVKFEDGVIVRGVTHAQFENRSIKHPNISGRTNKQAQSRIGMELVMKNGLKAKIVKYDNASSIDVLFENGILVKNRDWNSFRDKRMGMPRYVGKIFIKEFAYRLEDDWYYIVMRDDWKECKIMSVKQMYEHENTDCATIRKED